MTVLQKFGKKNQPPIISIPFTDSLDVSKILDSLDGGSLDYIKELLPKRKNNIQIQKNIYIFFTEI